MAEKRKRKNIHMSDEEKMVNKGTATKNVNSAGVLVLQWLSYAFWGWAAVSLWWLSALVVGHFVNAGNRDIYDYSGSTLAYAFAATLVLFIIALVCDMVYARREPQHKTGAASVIMIVHTVLYALIGIGTAIVAVFSIVNLLIGDSNINGNEGATTSLITALILAVVYAALVLRVLRPKSARWAVKAFWVVMAVITLGMMVASVVGPIAQRKSTADDRLIESGLPRVSDEISNYANTYNALPSNLHDSKLQLESDAKTLVERKLVDYQPGKEVIDPLKNTAGVSLDAKPVVNKTFRYQLCVTYIQGAGDTFSSRTYNFNSDQTSPDTYTHAKGRQCYNLVTESGIAR